MNRRTLFQTLVGGVLAAKAAPVVKVVTPDTFVFNTVAHPYVSYDLCAYGLSERAARAMDLQMRKIVDEV